LSTPNRLENAPCAGLIDPLTRALDRIALHLYDAIYRVGLTIDQPPHT
jgi:hypothetical protein